MCHVLIIEDEALVALAVEFALAEAGATSFDIATTEAEAIAAAQRNRPGLIASDVKLAEGTGPHAVAAIRRECGPTPVIFITGTPEDCRPREPADVVLVKPVQDGHLIATARQLIANL